MKLNQLLLLLFLFVFSRNVQAQGKLSGKIQDEAGRMVGFVNVAVLKVENGAVVTGTTAGAEGEFQIETVGSGTYKLKLTMMGYTTLVTEPFEVKNSNFTKDFGVLKMKEDAGLLKEVTVQAMRPVIISEAGKTIVNVEGTAMAGGATAFEVLTKAPGVWVDQDGNILLNGKAGVQITIDGKTAYLSGKELQSFLQTMPANNIKDLEIITSPSAKNDAEGGAGQINLNLKKNTISGMNGSVYAGYQYNNLNGYTLGSDLNFKQGKWNSFANLDLAERTRYRNNNMQRTYHNEQDLSLHQQVKEEGKRFIPALRFGADYLLNRRHSFGFTANLSGYTATDKINSNAFMHDDLPANDLYIQAANGIRTKNSTGTLNLHYAGKPDTLGSTLTADLDFVRLINESESGFRNTYNSPTETIPAFTDQLSATNPNSYTIYAARVDHFRKVGSFMKLESGAKASKVVSDNELRFYENKAGGQELDMARSNHFIYQENILAAYSNFSANLNSTWRIQGGLRAEQTFTDGKSVLLGQHTQKQYLGFFPSLFMQQTISNNYQISYSYGRRINRPRYSLLNPFIYYLDPYSVVMGNPDLKPQYTNAFTLTQTLQQRYNLVLDYATTKDFIVEVPAEISTGNVTVFQQQNIDAMKTISATLVAPVRITAKWEMNNQGTALYQTVAQNRKTTTLKNEQLSFMAQTNHSLQLPAGLRLEASAAYQSPFAYGLYDLKAQWWADAGLKRSFLKDKLDLSLNVTDIFRSKRIQASTQIENYSIQNDQYQGSQSFRINLRYRFSKGGKVDAAKRNGNLEEVNRAGNN